MIYRTYIEKFNTIIEGKELNCGINPVAELNYGNIVTRMLLYFDVCHLRNLYLSKTTPNLNKFKHVLKITNCGSIDMTQLHLGKISDIDDDIQIRASSFDLIFFLIPKEWDGGKGFDYKYTWFNQGYFNEYIPDKTDTKKLISIDGSNWYQAKNGDKWDEEGIFSNETLSKEYDKFSAQEESIIIGRQHFDIGCENINIDITQIVNKFITSELNNFGIGVAFSPALENIHDGRNNYVGFVTHKTHTFFEPFLESTYNDVIKDDRNEFFLNKNNRLYLFCTEGGCLTDLDVLPICTVDEKDYNVVHQSNGIYYAEINLSSEDYQPNTILYDIWSNIIVNGRHLEDVELEFVAKNSNQWLNISDTITRTHRYIPSISGIKNNETIYRGDIRKINILCRVPYTYNQAALLDNIELRLYTLDGERELDVITFDKVNRTKDENFYLLDTNMLIPHTYYVDVKVKYYNSEIIIHRKLLEFTIVNNINDKYY